MFTVILIILQSEVVISEILHSVFPDNAEHSSFLSEIIDIEAYKISWEQGAHVEEVLFYLSRNHVPIYPHFPSRRKFVASIKFYLPQKRQPHFIVYSSLTWLAETIANLTTQITINVMEDIIISINVNPTKSNAAAGFPSDPSTYGNLRFVIEVHLRQKISLFLCRICSPEFYTGVWKRFRKFKSFERDRITNFHGYQLNAWNVEQVNQPNTHVRVKSQYGHRAYKRFIFPHILAMLHFSDKVNATFVSCPCHPTQANLDFHFSTSDYHFSEVSSYPKHQYRQRFYTNDRFEITFITYNHLKPDSFKNLLVNPIGYKCYLITIFIMLGICMFSYLFVSFETKPRISVCTWIFVVTRPLLGQHVILPKISQRHKTPLNLVFFGWISYCLLLTELYRGNVYQHLFAPSYTSPPINFFQLINSPTYRSLTHEKTHRLSLHYFKIYVL